MPESYPTAAGYSNSEAREAAPQAGNGASAAAAVAERHPERTPGLTIGGGLWKPQGRFRALESWTPQAVAALVESLTGNESWWSPHCFAAGLTPRTESEARRGAPEMVERPDHYRQEDLWCGAVALGVDLDWHDREAPTPPGKDPDKMPPKGWHVAMPADAAARLLDAMNAGKLPGSIGHLTPRGGRAVALLAEPCQDTAEYDAAIDAYGQRLLEAVAALGLAHDGTRGLTFDESATDRARLLYAPRATVNGQRRTADVVVMRDALFTPADFPPVEVTTPAEAPPAAAKQPLPPVPWAHLPGRLGEYGRAVAANMEAPEPLVFGAMLAAISATVPATSLIEGRDPGHKEIAPLWIAPVAQPGSKKSPVVKRLLTPLEAHDARLQAAYLEAQEQHKAQCAALLAAKTGKQRSLAKVEQPPEPERAHILIDDFTFEALADVLATNHRHGLAVLLAPDELLALFGGFNQYKKNGTDRQRALKLWDGQTIRVHRRGRFIYAPDPRAALIGGIQPAVAMKLQALDENDGLLERLHWLDCREERAPAFDVLEVPADLEREYHDRLTALLPHLTAADLCPLPDATPEAEADAVTFTLSPEARAVYREFYLTCDRRGLRGWAAGYAGKIQGQCLRAALDLHHAEHGRDVFNRPQVSGDTMRAAVAVTRWLAAHTARIRSDLSPAATYPADVASLVRWLRGRGGRANLRDVQRANVAGVKSAAEAEALGSRAVAARACEWDTRSTTAGNESRELVVKGGE